jgi:ElaB/YqjD/DUF883 family membrane-anchored ribosome-binding protein
MKESSVEKIQQIKWNLDEIKKSVDDLNKEIIDLDESKPKLEQAEIDRKNKEIEEKKLEIKKKKEETQELIKQTRELADLEQDITITNEIRKELDSYEKQLNEIHPQSSTFWEKVKNVWWKTIERVKEHPWQTAGIWLAVSWIMYLFRRRKKKKEETESEGSDNKEKKGFWKTWFGKFFKRTWIWTAAYYISHGLFTGRWNLKDFFNRDKKENWVDNHDETQEQVWNYKKFIEKYPEKAEKYENFGEWVDWLYNNIFEKEIENWREDDSDMDTISKELWESYPLKWLVPFCMDNSFSSVDSMLSERWVEVDLYQKDFVEVKTKVLSRLKSKTWWPLKMFLEALPSWAKFGFWNTLEKKFEKWMESEPDARISELKSFFRQQMRVTVFLKTKEWELVKAIAQKKFETDKWDFEDPEHALDDSDWFEKNIKNDQDYKSFRSGKILNSYDILGRYNLMSGNISEDTEKIIQECDDKRDRVLDWKDWDDIIKRCESDITDGSLESSNQEQLAKSCDKITDDILDLEEVASNQAMDMYRRLFNTEHANKEELLKQSTILPLLQEIRKNIPGLKNKINAWEMSAEDIKSLKEFMNNYFALKKELAIWVNVYQMIKSGDGSWIMKITKLFEDMYKNTAKWFGKLFKWDIFSGLWWLLTWSAPIAIVAWWYFALRRYPWTTLKYTLLSPVILPQKLYQASLWTARKIWWKYYGPSWSLRRMFFNEADWPQKLLNELKRWNISLLKAQEIVDGSQVRTMTTIKNRWVDLFTLDNNLKKSTLLKKAFSNITRSDDEWKLLAKYFDNKSFNNLVVSNFDESLRLAKLYESKIISLNTKQVKLFDVVTNIRRLSSTDLDNLIKNIDQINLDDVWEKELSKVAKRLSKSISWLSSVDEINDFIKNSLKIWEILTSADKFAYKIWQLRDWNFDDFMRSFDWDWKLVWYSAEFKSKYLSVRWNALELAKLDYELAERLVRDWKKIEDVFELTLDQKNLLKFIDDDVVYLKTMYNKSNNAVRRVNYNRQIQSLEDMKLNKVPFFWADEFKYISNLDWLKLKPRYMAEIFDIIQSWKQIDLNWSMVKVADVIEEWDIHKIISVLSNKNNKQILWVSDDLINLLNREKNIFVKSFKWAVDMIKKIFKFIAKIR